jgi:hypothetical protein
VTLQSEGWILGVSISTGVEGEDDRLNKESRTSQKKGIDMIVTTTYQEYKMKGKKSGKCPGCGRRLTRSRTFGETLNPYNKNAAGMVKSPAEIHQSLAGKVERWEAVPVHCDAFGYYSWTKEERSEYEKNGKATVMLECGFKHEVVNVDGCAV